MRKAITTLWVDRLAMRKFKEQARKGYPKEIFGILLGIKRNANTFDVHEILVPPAVENTYEYVIPDYDAIRKIVDATHYVYIGSIHSHPQAPPTLSKHDVKAWDKEDIVIGILSIRKRTTYCTTELKVWRKDSPCPIEVKYF